MALDGPVPTRKAPKGSRAGRLPVRLATFLCSSLHLQPRQLRIAPGYSRVEECNLLGGRVGTRREHISALPVSRHQLPEPVLATLRASHRQVRIHHFSAQQAPPLRVAFRAVALLAAGYGLGAMPALNIAVLAGVGTRPRSQVGEEVDVRVGILREGRRVGGPDVAGGGNGVGAMGRGGFIRGAAGKPPCDMGAGGRLASRGRGMGSGARVVARTSLRGTMDGILAFRLF